MRPSLIRYPAVACIAAGGLLMGGTGAVAIADTPGDGTGGVEAPGDDGGTQAPEPTSAPRGFRLPRWMHLPNFSASSPDSRRVGLITPPVMNLPATLQSGSTDASTTRQPPTVTLPFVIDSPETKPAGRQPTGTVTVPETSPPEGAVDTQGTATPADEGAAGLEQVEGIPAAQVEAPGTGEIGTTATQQPSKPTATTARQPLTINLVPLVPRGVPVGPPLTIQNPLRQLLPADLDLAEPLAPQVLPAPLVTLLETVAQQIPLAGLVISPVMEFVVPPFFSDVVIPMLLSDIVVPTVPLASTLPRPVPAAPSPVINAMKPLARSEAPPAELALMGMDVLQSPAPLKPLPLTNELEVPQAPPSPPAPDPGISPLDDEVAYRAGYSDYLRNAGLAQITAIAVPGAAAILLFSLGGGFIGYRQARAGHVIRAEGITRFLR